MKPKEMNKKSVATILSYDKSKIPTIACFRNEQGSLTFICPSCKKQHYHGAGDKFGEGDGHRCSHCKEMQDTGYHLKEVKDWKLAGYLHKYDRDVSRKQVIKTKKFVEKYSFSEFDIRRIPDLEMTKNIKTFSVRWSPYPMAEDRLFVACMNEILQTEIHNIWNKHIDGFTRRSEMFSGGCGGSLRYVPKHVAYEMYRMVKKYYIQAVYRMKEVGYKNDASYLKYNEMTNMILTARWLFKTKGN